MATVLVTGAAGFIGFHLSQRLLARGDEVIGLDNLNDYYDVTLKKARLAQLVSHPGFRFVRRDLTDGDCLNDLFARFRPSSVVNLAAQAGVRYSLENPHSYVQSNLVGFVNVLEACRRYPVEHLVYASSSSVYGANSKIPFSTHDPADHPVSLYAATKRANELMAHTYSHLYGLPTTGLRFFTVYGPWGRPDMALFLFTQAILNDQPIDVFNYGRMRRDFTYIDDVVEGVVRVLARVPTPEPARPADAPDLSVGVAPYKLYNVGNSKPVDLLSFIQVIEKRLGRQAKLNLLPLQPGDVPETYAEVKYLMRDTGYQPNTPIEVGVGRFVDWYCDYYGVSAQKLSAPVRHLKAA